MRRILSVAVLALTLTATPLSAQARVGGGDPHFHEPTVGECHDYDYAGMSKQSDTTPVVDCATKHTGKVVAVWQLPAAWDWATLTDKQFLSMVTNKCLPAWDAMLGVNALTRVLTPYAPNVYKPTKSERAAGARWMRCDVFLYRGKQVAPLPYDVSPMVPSPLPKTLRRCLTPKFAWTNCTKPHVYKATGSFNLSKQSTYPTDRQVRRQALRKCPALVTTRAFAWHAPYRYEWAHGMRATVCYSKTSK